MLVINVIETHFFSNVKLTLKVDRVRIYKSLADITGLCAAKDCMLPVRLATSTRSFRLSSVLNITVP